LGNVSKPSNRSKAFRDDKLINMLLADDVSKPSNRSKAFRAPLLGLISGTNFVSKPSNRSKAFREIITEEQAFSLKFQNLLTGLRHSGCDGFGWFAQPY